MTASASRGRPRSGCLTCCIWSLAIFAACTLGFYLQFPESRPTRDLSKYSTLEISGFRYITRKELAAYRAVSAKALAEIQDRSLHSRFNGNIRLNGLTDLQPVTAESLSEFFPNTDLTLTGVTSLSDNVARILARHKGSLYLDGVTSVSESVASILSQHAGAVLSLRGLGSLGDPQLQELRKHKGCILAEAGKAERDP